MIYKRWPRRWVIYLAHANMHVLDVAVTLVTLQLGCREVGIVARYGLEYGAVGKAAVIGIFGYLVKRGGRWGQATVKAMYVSNWILGAVVVWNLLMGALAYIY